MLGEKGIVFSKNVESLVVLTLSSGRHTYKNIWGEQIGLEELKERVQSYMGKERRVV